MSSNKTGMIQPKTQSKKNLKATLVCMLAAGAAGGTILIAGAKALGEAIEKKQIGIYERLEGEREAKKEEVRRIMSNDVQDMYKEK